MVVRTAPRASPLLEAVVVTLHDGRLGFSARFADVRQVDGAPLLLYTAGATGGEATHSGVAHVVRSGSAYDEVRGRTREALSWWARGRLRAETAVVVLDERRQASNSA
jgi:hypothetical protein